MIEKRVSILKEGMFRNRFNFLGSMIGRKHPLVWEPERGDCNNPVMRCPSLLLWLGSSVASSQLEEALIACCCATPESDEEVSGRHH